MTTQKDQLLAGSSPTAIVASQAAPAATAAAAAATDPAPAATVAAAAAAAAPAQAAKPGPDEKCSACGQTMPKDDDEDDANAKAPSYTVEMAIETMELCAIAKLPTSEAKAFVTAKTPIAGVRAALAKKAADATNAQVVDGTSKPAGSAETDVAAAWDQVVTEQNAKIAKR